MSIGSRITEWRKARGYTQAKLAQESGLSPSTIAMFENNQRMPDDAAIRTLATALGIPPALLTGDSGSVRQETRASAPATTRVAHTTNMRPSNDSLEALTFPRPTPAETSRVSRAHAGPSPTRSPATSGRTGGDSEASAEQREHRGEQRGDGEVTLQPDPTSAMPSSKPSLSSFVLTPEEAKVILFLRMNPSSMEFLESYIRSDARQRDQLSRTWRLIHELQRPQG